MLLAVGDALVAACLTLVVVLLVFGFGWPMFFAWAWRPLRLWQMRAERREEYARLSRARGRAVSAPDHVPGFWRARLHM
jgi:hypothetical protein